MAVAAHAASGAPWYRQLWPWLLIALPGASVVGGVAALVIAVRHADSVVRDDWYARGLAINVDLGLERVAADLGVEATLSLDGTPDRLRATLGDAGVAPDALDVELQHPTQAVRDRTLRLVRGADGAYRGGGAGDLRGRWTAAVVPAEGTWRVGGTIELGPGVAARLGPRS